MKDKIIIKLIKKEKQENISKFVNLNINIR